ncbi:hypothetical protein [Streptomyces luteocolor]|uniref:hypothetical protein n=1 Tax=Streptomyces luteocolor TaxID=285500 RepID=UPI0006EBD5FC|nr:hypothetical protein [Streptomyces luteocolor]MCF3123768.1 hypothetical protein [Streptomyces arenae]
MVLTVDLAVLLAIVIFILVRRPPKPRKRIDAVLTMTLVLVFGVLIAPTSFGHWILDATNDLAQGVTQAATP